MGILYSQPISREYTGNVANSAILRLILDVGLCFVVPFLVAYSTGYLWIKEWTYWEQADIVFTNKVVARVTGSGGEVVEWVSIPEMEKYIPSDTFTPMFLEAYAEDLNGNNRPDRVFLNLKIPLPPTAFKPVSIDAVYLFQWDIKDKVRVSMEGLAEVSYRSSGEALHDVAVDADLLFHQRSPLVWNPFTDYDEIYNKTLFDPTVVTSPAQVQIPHILSMYGSRNESLVTFPTSVAVTPYTLAGQQPFLTVRLTLRNPVQPITHTADFPLLFKFGLIQFFVFWFMFSGVAKFLKKVVIENGFINTVAKVRGVPELQRKRVL